MVKYNFEYGHKKREENILMVGKKEKEKETEKMKKNEMEYTIFQGFVCRQGLFQSI